MSKTTLQRNYYLPYILLILSVILWVYLFRFFLNGSSPLKGDAYPYLGHIRFYLENITQGIYPLWNSGENGNVNEFFLRRIGEFNPFFFFITFLDTIGFSFAVAHRLFLGFYFLFGVAGFYLLAMRIFNDRIPATISALLLLFSSWGGKLFKSFIVLEFVPLIWFSFFAISFLQKPKYFSALGAVFCLMIINITYVPFYFYTILFIFFFMAGIIYFNQIKMITHNANTFIGKNKKFSSLCCILILLSLIPGFLWYSAAQQGNAYSPKRHSGTMQTSNTATVSIKSVNEGGILPYLIFNRQFINLDKVHLGDPYLPVFAFLMLISGIWLPLSRRFILWFIYGAIIFLIGLADASNLHGFLYNHIVFFKYFRNPQFFLWLALIPVFILFISGQTHALIKTLPHQRWTATWTILVHVAALLFCLIQETTGISTYLAIILSLIWIITILLKTTNVRISFWILWAAIILQPFDVLGHWAQYYPPVEASRYAFKNTSTVSLPSKQQAHALIHSPQLIFSEKQYKPATPHFAVGWYYHALEQIPVHILNRYISVPFWTYDSIESVQHEESQIDNIQQAMSDFQNIAFVHANIPGYKNPAKEHARIIINEDKDFSIIKSNANSLVFKTAFEKDQFLVWTSNYHNQWKAYIDNTETSIYRTNILAQGIQVPAGEHIVRWQFGPKWRYLLAYFFIILYIGILGTIVWMASRSKKA